MKFDVVMLLALVALVTSETTYIEDICDLEVPANITAYGYHTKIGIPLATKIRKAESEPQSSNIFLVSRGSIARLGELPFQAGILADLTTGHKSACGGSLLNSWRVLTAAHCWFDGVRQSWRFMVVLGSVTLFSGGQRIIASDVIMHGDWNPRRAGNDIAMVMLPTPVVYSDNIAPISLPSGKDLKETYDGCTATVSGFGATRERGNVSPILNQVDLHVISNAECARTFPIIRPSNICTSGDGGKSSCGGDSGGPLVVWRKGKRILIGITSFGHIEGCEHGHPVVFTRVSYYIKWINYLLKYTPNRKHLKNQYTYRYNQ